MKKLSLRLQTIFELVPFGYDVIWDLCCDHGYLGLMLAKEKISEQVFLIDCVPSIIENLQARLKKLPQIKNVAQAGLQDAGTIQLVEKKKQLLIISGVGGLATIELLQQIFSNNPSQEKPDLLLSPKHHLFAVRKFLISQGYQLINETLSFENSRSYENLLVSQDGELPLVDTGSIQWNIDDSQHLDYLNIQIEHNRRKQAHAIVEKYCALQVSLD
ncbi:tRNA (adenine(22)-N(1))-methyltransferase TrmK [Pelagibaculum spongiae]|nr:tRNA (adenine(22)-N(1))-methyltransferase TrmK [Pelagibaculum spongiae]